MRTLIPFGSVTTPGHSGDVGDGVASRADTLSDLSRQCADRLRRLPESRLNKVAPTARELAQLLADAAQGVEARDAQGPPRRRVVPTLNVFALGDQIAVTATDLAVAIDGLDDPQPVWWHGARHPLAEVLSELLAAVQGLRAQV